MDFDDQNYTYLIFSYTNQNFLVSVQRKILAPLYILQINDDNVVTEVTQVTEFKGATPLSTIHDKEDYNNSNNIIANPKTVPLIM